MNLLDLQINNIMSGIQTPFLVKLISIITFIGDVKVLLPLSFILVLYFFLKKETLKASLIASTFLLGVLTSEILKFFVSRTRPENALQPLLDSSFPSGHALMSTLYFLLIIYLFNDKIKDKILRNIFTAFFILLPVLISFSRLYLNIHWFTDVFAGFLIGISWFVIFIKLGKLENIAMD